MYTCIDKSMQIVLKQGSIDNLLILKGGDNMKLFSCLVFNLGLNIYCSHKFLEIFLLNKFLQRRGKFPLLIVFLLAPTGCGVNRVWLQRDVRIRTLVHCRASLRQRNDEYLCGGWVFEHP